MRKTFSIVMGLVMIAILGVAGTTPAQAWSYRDANIKNNGKIAFPVCRDWGKTTCAGSWYMLYPGKNARTEFGWSDTDGYRVRKGYVSSQGYVGQRDVQTHGRGGLTYYITVVKR